MLSRVINWYKNLPNRKPWVDLVTAVLTIPVLVTILITNIGNLKKTGNANEMNDSPATPTIIERVITQYVIPSKGPEETIKPNEPSVTPSLEKNNTDTPTPVCSLDPQPYEITFPKEQETVTLDPVCITMESRGNDFCPTQWAYRVNNSSWSSYTNDPICLYNMAPGPLSLEIRTKSTVSGREKTYVRNFTYGPPATPTPTPSVPLATPSA